MKQKEITLAGRTYPVIFNMQALINFERIVKGSFFETDFTMFADRVAMVIGAIIAADKDADIDYDTVVKNADVKTLQEFISAYAIVMELAGEFFKLPEVEQKDEKPAEEPQEGEGKN